MSYDEYFAVLEEKYGDDFNWGRTSADSFADELKRELGMERGSDSITVIARCEANDNILVLINGVYRIYHLTYSGRADSPGCLEFSKISEAMDHIEKDYVENYL